MHRFKLWAILPLLIFAWSCEEDNDDNNNEPSATTAAVKMMYDYKFGNDDFALDTYYSLDAGEKVKFSLASFYLSMPNFMDDEGNATPLDPQYIIVRPGDMPTSFGEMEPGHVHMFNFSIGVDEATNTESGATGRQPSDFTDAAHPLAPQPEGMYWSWASGYIFVKLEGEIDYDGDNQADTTFKYHLGVNDLRKDRSETFHSNMTAGEDFEMEMTIDLKRVFDNVDLNTEVLTMTMGGPGPRMLAEKVMSNFNNGVSVAKHGGDGHNH